MTTIQGYFDYRREHDLPEFGLRNFQQELAHIIELKDQGLRKKAKARMNAIGITKIEKSGKIWLVDYEKVTK